MQNSQTAPKTSSYINLNTFNFKSKPLKDLNIPLDLQILSLQVSAHGQDGVIFIQIKEGSFVIKCNGSVPKQLFYNEMAEKLGLRVPKTMFFSIEDQIHSKILLAFQKYCAKKDQNLFARLKSKFLSLFYSLMQYIPSIQFQSISSQKFQKNLLTPEKLHEIGLCLGYDMIINNNDRFQLLWGGDGNLPNVLIEISIQQLQKYQLKQIRSRQEKGVKLQGYVFIDNQGHMCDVSNQYIANNVKFYFDKLIKFIQQMYTFLEEINNEIKQQSKFLNNSNLNKFMTHVQLYTGYKFKQRDIQQIMLGVRDLIDCFIFLHKNNEFQQILQKIKDLGVKKLNIFQIKKQWDQQLCNISINYCDMLFQKVQPLTRQHYQKEKIKNVLKVNSLKQI